MRFFSYDINCKFYFCGFQDVKDFRWLGIFCRGKVINKHILYNIKYTCIVYKYTSLYTYSHCGHNN